MLVYTKKYKYHVKHNPTDGPHVIYEQSNIDSEDTYIPFGLLVKINKFSYAVWAYNHITTCSVSGNFVSWSISKSLFDSEYRLVNQNVNIDSQIHNLLLYKQIINKYKNNPDTLSFTSYDDVITNFNNILNRIKKKIKYPEDIVFNIFQFV